LAVTTRVNSHAGLIWAVADLLRGDYKQSEYGRVILPLIVLRRLDCVLEPTKDEVLARLEQLKGKLENVGPVLQPITGIDVYNTSPLTLRKILADPNQVAGNLRGWIAGFDPETRDVIEKFDFDTQIGRLDRAKLLYHVLARVTEVDLHPGMVSNVEMGYLYEELIRRFSELSNETAGEHFTPREVIRLMVDLLFIEDDEALRTPGIVRTMLDPACGTGGMLSIAAEYIRELNPRATLEGYGQELNAETYAVCRSDMMLKGRRASNIRLGNCFSEDAFTGSRFDYLLANPPFGVEWTKVQGVVTREHEELGLNGRFGAGLPRVTDGSFLFLEHMISKWKGPDEGGGRIAIVFNGSPLATGSAGSGESEIRRWILENDWLEGIVALPDQLFYNTEISTYFWILTNRKRPEREGLVQLVDARDLFLRMRKSLGEKRKYISPEQIREIVRLYGNLQAGDRVELIPRQDLCHQRITVESPLRLRWEIDENRLQGLRAASSWAKLSNAERLEIDSRLTQLSGFTSTVRADVARQIGPIPKVIDKSIWDAFAVRDPLAPAVLDSRGRPVPDKELRFMENAPLPGPLGGYALDLSARLADQDYRTAVEAFFSAEVLPFFPDSWVDHSKTRIGTEIPLVRYFHQFVPPRTVMAIDEDIATMTELARGRESALENWRSSNTVRTTQPARPSRRLRPRIALDPSWPLMPARALFVLQKRAPREQDETVTAFRDGEVNLRSLRREEGFTNALQEVGYQGVRAGDLVIHSMDASAGAIGVSLADGKASPVVHCYRARAGLELDPRFYAYLLRLYAWSGFIGSLAKGIRARSSAFDSDTFLSLALPYPPFDVQRAIADRLDAELSKLDASLEARKRVVSLIGERKQATVAAALADSAVVADK
jgi:type I restriction enzyme M protein